MPNRKACRQEYASRSQGKVTARSEVHSKYIGCRWDQWEICLATSLPASGTRLMGTSSRRLDRSTCDIVICVRFVITWFCRWDAADGTRYYNLPGSRSADIRNLYYD